MKKNWKGISFETRLNRDNQEGWASLDLHSDAEGVDSIVARVVYWDAEGQFFLEMAPDELPLTVVQELIVEAQEKIPYR